MLDTMARPKKKQPDDDGEFHLYQIRVPKALWPEIVANAEANFRSINQHIIWVLREHLKQSRDDAPTA